MNRGTANIYGAVPLYPALRRPHLEHCIQYKKYSEQVNQIQQKIIAMVGAGAFALSGKAEEAGLVHTREWKASKRPNGNLLVLPGRSSGIGCQALHSGA